MARTRPILTVFAFLVPLAIAAYTQFFQLTEIPGLHFDEAWQAMHAYEIASEPSFWPTGAMNAYTTPIVHYILAAVFTVFGPTLFVLRAAYGFANLLTLVLIGLWIFRRSRSKLAVLWFGLLWGLLPLSVHTHRFYVEMTGFFGLCLALALWGCELYFTTKWRRAGATMALLAITFATYSHILFVSVFVAGVLALALFHPQKWDNLSTRRWIAAQAILLSILPIRMGLGLHKILPFILAILLAGLALVVLHKRSAKIITLRCIQPLRRRQDRTTVAISALALPFLFGFLMLMWNGFWPYAQATGILNLNWLPINTVLFGIAALAALSRFGREIEDVSFFVFLVTFLVGSVLILKQVPRYYTLPMILAMIWIALELRHIKEWGIHAVLIAIFVAWNAHAFRHDYVKPYSGRGPSDFEFRLGPFHDNARDFRVMQRAYRWLEQQQCDATLAWVENDRFLKPLQFLKISAETYRKKHHKPPHDQFCKWSKTEMFFSYIPNYDEAFEERRTEFNTPPPWPNVKFLAHSKEWGDLAFWRRR